MSVLKLFGAGVSGTGVVLPPTIVGVQIRNGSNAGSPDAFSLNEGSLINLFAMVLYSDTTSVPYSNLIGSNITWSETSAFLSLSADMANQVTVTAAAVSTAQLAQQVSVSITTTAGVFTDTIDIDVLDTIGPTLTGIEIRRGSNSGNPAGFTMYESDAAGLFAVEVYSDNSFVPCTGTINWTTSSPYFSFSGQVDNQVLLSTVANVGVNQTNQVVTVTNVGVGTDTISINITHSAPPPNDTTMYVTASNAVNGTIFDAGSLGGNPPNASIDPSGSVTLTANPGGTGPFTYTWYANPNGMGTVVLSNSQTCVIVGSNTALFPNDLYLNPSITCVVSGATGSAQLSWPWVRRRAVPVFPTSYVVATVGPATFSTYVSGRFAPGTTTVSIGIDFANVNPPVTFSNFNSTVPNLTPTSGNAQGGLSPTSYYITCAAVSPTASGQVTATASINVGSNDPTWVQTSASMPITVPITAGQPPTMSMAPVTLAFPIGVAQMIGPIIWQGGLGSNLLHTAYISPAELAAAGLTFNNSGSAYNQVNGTYSLSLTATPGYTPGATVNCYFLVTTIPYFDYSEGGMYTYAGSLVITTA